VVVAALTFIFPLKTLAELVNIGTLFAFVLVAIGVIFLRRSRPDLPRPFSTPFVPVLPILSVLGGSGPLRSVGAPPRPAAGRAVGGAAWLARLAPAFGRPIEVGLRGIRL
jgi:amino acid transporter